MKKRTAVHSWFDPHTIHSLFFVFPSDVWCKINKLLKYYEYQLTKRCLEGRLEGFKVSSWFLKIMKLIEYRMLRNVTIFIIVVDGCIIIIHEVVTCDSTLMKQSLTLTIKSVGFAPFVVRVREGIRVNRIIKITHVHNLHEKRLEFGPFMIPRKKKKANCLAENFLKRF